MEAQIADQVLTVKHRRAKSIGYQGANKYPGKEDANTSNPAFNAICCLSMSSMKD